MDPNVNQHQQTLLRAIAVSSLPLPSFTAADRQQAFAILENLKSYNDRIPLCIGWLHSDRHVFEGNDITVATKLLALEILSSFLFKGYSSLGEVDRVSFREAILKASRLLCSNLEPPSAETRILSRKFATILEGLVIRDFPQRWTCFSPQVFAPYSQGGLWYDEPGLKAGRHVGVRICLECLRLAAEDCTDSDFNAHISTSRRNDVLKGLNEVSNQFLPLLFQLLEHHPLIQQSKATLQNMHTYLLGQNRTINSMTTDEAAMYREEVEHVEEISSLIVDTLRTLDKFCGSMPLNWITGGTPDFMVPMLFFLRENEANIQVVASECLEQLVLRGKLGFSQWLELVSQLPLAVQDANQAFVTTQEQRKAASAAGGRLEELDPLTSQLAFHRALSRLLATILSASIAHITSSKSILKQAGEQHEKFAAFVRVAVDLLHHPSGRVCTEQINTWTALLRDPQMARAGLLQAFVGEIVSCYIDHMVRVRWGDIESQTHPHAKLLEASFDDEENYDAWMADFRSRTSLLFKFAGNTEPGVASQVINARVQSLLKLHGSGEPRNYLHPSNGQLTLKSEAVMKFEGIVQPLENVMSGIPSWAMSSAASSTTSSAENREGKRSDTKAALSELSQALVSWKPTYLWLKFRRASLLDGLKFYWKHDPATLLQAVDSLLRYLGLGDEWQPGSTPNETKLSGQIVGLKKKSGVTLVSVAKKVPHHLVPWLSQLSDATRTLLSSNGLIPMNQMHLYEFLSCIATAVEDPHARANFIGGVLSSSLETLESASIQRSIASVPALLETLGVAQAASSPASVTDPENVRNVASNYSRLFTALNQLLSVGRRCHEASRKAGTTTPGLPAAQFGVSAPTLQEFPDEGPVSIQDLAVNDPFVPLWPRILPSLLQVYEVTLGVWRHEHQASLLQNPYQRYVYAISDDEAFLSKNHDGKSGGVFGDGGTAGSVVAGASRRDVNLVPKWSGWFSELRNTCFQMFGFLAAQRVLFAPEVAHFYPRIVSVLTEPISLKSMEHRHFIQFQKHVVEFLLVNCPSTLYKTHLEPIISPIFVHIRFRMEKTWLPILDNSCASTVSTHGSAPAATKALSSGDCSKAAVMASRGDDDWFCWYYAHAGLFVGDLDSVTAEAAVEKSRVDLSRSFSDMMQVALALKGPWALTLANRAKEEQAIKKSDSSKLVDGPHNRFDTEEWIQVNADGTPKTANQAATDARKLLRINRLCHFLLLESELIAGNLTLTVLQCLGYPDAYTCRRISKVCHRILETVAWSPQYAQLLGQHMLTQAVKNIVAEPKWMVGIEWDMINVVRDIYCRLVLGQTLQFGGQGPSQQQVSLGPNDSSFEQAKTVEDPLQGGGILTVPSNKAREVFLALPGTSPGSVQEFEQTMKRKLSAKDQKDAIRDLLRMAADNLREISPTSVSEGAAAGIFDRAVEEESLLHSNSREKAVPDLPEKLVTYSQMMKSKSRSNADEPEGLSSFQL